VAATADRKREYVGEEMTLVEHLEELRSRLFKCAIALVVGFTAGFLLRDQVIALLREPYCGLPASIRASNLTAASEECQLVFLTVTGSFIFSIKAATIVAVIIAAPVVAYQILRFVTPGLRPIEKQYLIPFVVATALLFLGGAAFSFFLIPRALEFLLTFTEGLVSIMDANAYMSFVLNTMIGFGLSFEFPLVLILLSFAGLVTARGLRRARRHAIFGAFVLAAIITPTQDPITLLAMGLPLVVFYEIAAGVAWLIERNRARAAAAAGTVGA
jgi:sec-independent protein translocase protein TatC